MTTTITRPATAKQAWFVRKLIAERTASLAALPGAADNLLADFCADKALDTRQASTLINALMSLPTNSTPIRAKQLARPVVDPGYYVTADGVVYVVVENRAGTATYAKRMVVTDGRGSWEYAPGGTAALAGLAPLSVERAAELGHQHGVCMICGRGLTDPDSVRRGIGPVCSAKL